MLSFTTLAVTLEEADAYAAARAWANWTGTNDAKTAALRRGQDAIASMYNSRWIVEFDDEDAPEQVQFAIIEAARRELVKPGSMSPDLKRGGKIKAVGAGSARVEFADGAPAETTYSIIDGLLAGLVAPKSASLVGFAVRA